MQSQIVTSIPGITIASIYGNDYPLLKYMFQREMRSKEEASKVKQNNKACI